MCMLRRETHLAASSLAQRAWAASDTPWLREASQASASPTCARGACPDRSTAMTAACSECALFRHASATLETASRRAMKVSAASTCRHHASTCLRVHSHLQLPGGILDSIAALMNSTTCALGCMPAGQGQGRQSPGACQPDMRPQGSPMQHPARRADSARQCPYHTTQNGSL